MSTHYASGARSMLQSFAKQKLQSKVKLRVARAQMASFRSIGKVEPVPGHLPFSLDDYTFPNWPPLHANAFTAFQLLPSKRKRRMRMKIVKTVASSQEAALDVPLCSVETLKQVSPEDIQQCLQMPVSEVR